MAGARIIRFRNTNVLPVVIAAVRQFMPQAGKRIEGRARKKIGIYQIGWRPLRASTLERKRRRRPRRGLKVSFGIADVPLLDTGAMRAGVSSFAQSNTAHVTAPSPMEYHEQDPAMLAVNPPHLPRRAVLGPSLEEEMPSLVPDLEVFVAIRI